MNLENVEVYTDGSYHDLSGYKDKTYGAIFIPTLDNQEWSFYTTHPEYVGSRNVGGEVLAAEFAISLICRYYDSLNGNKDVTAVHIHLYYDYEGVGKWLTGEWRAKKNLTIAYKRYVNNLLKKRNIKLFPHHVTGHAGVAGNERVDSLAVSAYQSENCYDANSFVEEVLKV